MTKQGNKKKLSDIDKVDIIKDKVDIIKDKVDIIKDKVDIIKDKVNFIKSFISDKIERGSGTEIYEEITAFDGYNNIFKAKLIRKEYADEYENVVLKIIRCDSQYEKDVNLQDANMMLREIHPNILALKSDPFFTQDNNLVIPMEAGECTLTEYLSKMTPEMKSEFAIQLVDALDAIHKKDKIHGDLKPDNIFIVDGIPKIADFGLSTFGTGGFRHPDLIRAEKEQRYIDEMKSDDRKRWDDYAMAMTIYKMFCYTHIHEGSSFVHNIKGESEAVGLSKNDINRLAKALDGLENKKLIIDAVVSAINGEKENMKPLKPPNIKKILIDYFKKHPSRLGFIISFLFVFFLAGVYTSNKMPDAPCASRMLLGLTISEQCCQDLKTQSKQLENNENWQQLIDSVDGIKSTDPCFIGLFESLEKARYAKLAISISPDDIQKQINSIQTDFENFLTAQKIELDKINHKQSIPKPDLSPKEILEKMKNWTHITINGKKIEVITPKIIENVEKAIQEWINSEKKEK